MTNPNPSCSIQLSNAIATLKSYSMNGCILTQTLANPNPNLTVTNPNPNPN